MDSTETAEDFLKIASNFKLGCLLTEQQNPRTIGLSSLAQQDLKTAISILKEIDVDTIGILKSKILELELLAAEINTTLEQNGRVFICGCGATGRLSLVLETLWRQETEQLIPEWHDRVAAFMAGGDAALIKSIESFEDHPEFAAQQLSELGFAENDLLIGSTEGGETPWVIGAVWHATKLSSRKPYILYGNTDEILKENVSRSKEFIDSDNIMKINCNVGYMVLAGSTRMQSTTILMHAIGLALLGCERLRQRKGDDGEWLVYAKKNVQCLEQYLKETDLNVIGKLIEYESELYSAKRGVTYETDGYYAITVITDTTERSPTFSLPPFHNIYQPKQKDPWCNLKILSLNVEHNPDSGNHNEWNERVEQDWQALLAGRKIRGLDSSYWEKFKEKVSHQAILGFGIHESYADVIRIEFPFVFTVESQEKEIMKISLPELPIPCQLCHHTVLKIVLNMHSTLIMGRMHRYESNIMTYVKPTNYKLIDRAARYIMMLRKQANYEEVVRAIYAIRGQIGCDEAIVLKVVEYLDNKQKSKEQIDKETKEIE